MKNNNNLFYTCSLIELIGRITKNTRKDVVEYLGDDLKRIYSHADVFHCEPIEKVKYPVPDYWDIGEVFQRLVEDTSDEEHVVEGIRKVFSSWIAERILNFNSDLFYQPREYIAECYRAGVIIPA